FLLSSDPATSDISTLSLHDALPILAGSDRGINRNAMATTPHQESDIVAVDFDPRRNLTFWIDSLQKKVFRSALPKGNQSHEGQPDRKSTRLNSSHVAISYAVFCLKK